MLAFDKESSRYLVSYPLNKVCIKREKTLTEISMDDEARK